MDEAEPSPARAPLDFEHSDPKVDRQYRALDILDSKASALLTFNAIALASIAIWLANVSLNFLHLALDLVFLVLLASCSALLAIIALRWALQGEDFESLDATRAKRTRYYRFAWRLSIGAIGCLIAISTVHTFGTMLIATENCSDTCQRFFSEDVFGNLDVKDR